MALSQHSMFSLLPEEISGWKSVGEDQEFNKTNLYQYINGGAELYISYGFQNSVTRIFQREGQPDLVVDIFDMNNSFNAIGVFMHTREVIDTTFGQGSQYSSGMLLFWKDKYFVSILSSPETPESKKIIQSLGYHIDRAIVKVGKIPDLINLLPEEGLIKESIRYFHHYIWQNTYYYISDQNILNINENTEVVLAKVEGAENRLVLMIIKYPDSLSAKMAHTQFEKRSGFEQSHKTGTNTWTGSERIKNYILLCMNAKNIETGQKLINRVVKKIESNKKKE